MNEKEKELWNKIVNVARKIKYGELRIIMQDGKPVRIEQIVKSVKLDSDEREDPEDLIVI